MICFEEHPRSAMRSAACKHGFCTDCWAGYLSNAVTSGPSVLDLRCPLPDCKAGVRSMRSMRSSRAAVLAAVARSTTGTRMQQSNSRVQLQRLKLVEK
jgi:hypothetical protein